MADITTSYMREKLDKLEARLNELRETDRLADQLALLQDIRYYAGLIRDEAARQVDFNTKDVQHTGAIRATIGDPTPAGRMNRILDDLGSVPPSHYDES